MIAFISCPPMSKINETSSLKYLAAVKWEIVSTSLTSILNADLIKASPYPVDPAWTSSTPLGKIS